MTMRQKQGVLSSVEKTVKDIPRTTRKRHAMEEKICIVLEGLRDASNRQICWYAFNLLP